jgi:mannose-1-phosphate guanylyltransferase/mannose-1-phosphate guanylyltransferase/mannose-6-phosphate isomerase
MTAITPAIMIGGTGTRLWPLSRTDRPKQFHSLGTEGSLLQQTLRRFGAAPYGAPWLLTGEGGVALGETHAEAAGIRVAGVVVEPAVRSTAPALAAAAYAIGADDPDRLILAAPADHLMTAPEDFHRAVAAAAPAARAGAIVTFGIRPTHPETGFGYIAVGEGLTGTGGVHVVDSFVEKPAREVAEAYLAGGRHLWNAGIFLFVAGSLITEVERHAPEVASAVRRAIMKARVSRNRVILDRESYAAAPEISIDNAVMEKSDRVAVAPCDPGWNDVGSWAAVHEVSRADAAGNAFVGDVVATATENCLVQSVGGRLVAITGVSGLAVIDTADATLIAGLDATQNVKDLVKLATRARRPEVSTSPVGEHAWGVVRHLAGGDRCAVRHLTLRAGRDAPTERAAPGGTTVTIVGGSMDVLVDGRRLHARPGESFAVPSGSTWRASNPGASDTEVVAVDTLDAIPVTMPARAVAAAAAGRDPDADTVSELAGAVAAAARHALAAG